MKLPVQIFKINVLGQVGEAGLPHAWVSLDKVGGWVPACLPLLSPSLEPRNGLHTGPGVPGGLGEPGNPAWVCPNPGKDLLPLQRQLPQPPRGEPTAEAKAPSPRTPSGSALLSGPRAAGLTSTAVQMERSSDSTFSR